MSDIIVISASEARDRVNQISKRLLEILLEFNKAYPDAEAEGVLPYFDYLTENYIAQVCGSVLTDKLMIMPPGVSSIGRKDFLQQSQAKFRVLSKEDNKIEA